MEQELCICQASESFGLTEIGNIIIAFLTLALAYYVFVYQKQQDAKNIRLQWFKELIMQPKLQSIYNFYDNIFGIKQYFNCSDLSEEEKIIIIDFIKREQFNLRKSFVDILQLTAPLLHQEVQSNLDRLIDGLTTTIDNDELKLNNPNTYNREIEQKIEQSYNNLFASIFKHKG